MKNIRICTPVTGDTMQQFLYNLEEIQKISDLVELRVDHIQDFTLKDIDLLKKKTTKKAIFTCRKVGEGGKRKVPEKERVAFISKAIKLGFDYVDIEFTTLSDHFFNFDGPTKIIASYHNFDRTNQFPTLCSYINQIDLANVDIIKISTLVNSDDDNKTLLRLLVERPTHKDMIVIGMGKKGVLTRIVAPLLGSYMTFASTPFSQSAPGQIPLEELKISYERYARLSSTD